MTFFNSAGEMSTTFSTPLAIGVGGGQFSLHYFKAYPLDRFSTMERFLIDISGVDWSFFPDYVGEWVDLEYEGARRRGYIRSFEPYQSILRADLCGEVVIEFEIGQDANA